MKLLITGGTGYIASHAIVELLNSNHQIVALDNLSNSSEAPLSSIQTITRRELKFYKEDIRNEAALNDIFEQEKFDAVIHFAGLKAVGASCNIPLVYYDNNVAGTLSLLRVMKEHGVFTLVFSSSATVYGNSEQVPLTEDLPLEGINPYGRTKIMIEQILTDLHASDDRWNIALLRYFNPIGAHESGLLGDAPKGIPTNLLPNVANAASGSLEFLNVFGNDYPTKDGTAIRDYIHVVDLAKGHISALEKLYQQHPGLVIYNLGTGNGYSVLDVIHTYESVSNRTINYRIVERRQGDVAVSYADASKARRELGWSAEKSLKDMCIDSWSWQLNRK